MQHCNRFPREVRLLNGRDYTNVFSDVQYKTGNRHLLMLATPRQGDERCNARVGFIIARRHVKRATDRNRLKRVIRESFRHKRNKLPAIDIIVLARPGAGTLDNQKLYQQLDRLWEKLRYQVDPAYH